MLSEENTDGAAEGDCFPSKGDASDLVTVVQSASQIADGPNRDASLVAALRICRRELEAAEAESAAAKLRLSEAEETFNCAAELLAGGTPSTLWDSTAGRGSKNKRKRGGEGLRSGMDAYWRRAKARMSSSSPGTDNQSANAVFSITAAVPVPTNPIHMPPSYIADQSRDALMTPSMVADHREKFYQKLLGVSAADADIYTPNLNQANLRSKAQLVEGIYIVRHWDTGTEDYDAAAFRSKHKTWYTKMKPLSHSMGRRTGIHLRTVEPRQMEGGEGETVLCRYNRDGTKSIVYLDICQLYDALFEVHCLEHDHQRGKDAAKLRVDELYANIPDSQVKLFVDTCPVCIEQRKAQQQEVWLR